MAIHEGPWKVEPNPELDPLEPAPYWVTGPDGDQVATAYTEDLARAIAALPELIAVCRTIQGLPHLGRLSDPGETLQTILDRIDRKDKPPR